jgi:hypothetical protein
MAEAVGDDPMFSIVEEEIYSKTLHPEDEFDPEDESGEAAGSHSFHQVLRAHTCIVCLHLSSSGSTR